MSTADIHQIVYELMTIKDHVDSIENEIKEMSEGDFSRGCNRPDDSIVGCLIRLKEEQTELIKKRDEFNNFISNPDNARTIVKMHNVTTEIADLEARIIDLANSSILKNNSSYGNYF